jgi:predicted MFS family arabinose efflux permease
MPQLVALHVLRGVGWSAFLTAVLALVADLAPPARRGETVGYFGMANNLAMALSPSAGVLVLNAFGFGSLFMTASAVVSVSFLSTVLTSRPARGATEGPGPRSRFDFIELRALFPMLVICFFATAYGSLVIYLPLYSPERGLDNPGLFFIPYSLVAMSTRSLAGRTSDRLGRSITIVPGMLLAAVALVVHSQAASVSMFITVAVMFGLAFSLVTPSLMALLIDRVRPEARGVAVGTFTAGFDLGVGLGAFISGRLLELMDFPAMYRLVAGAPLAGLVIFVLVRRTHRREGPSG